MICQTIYSMLNTGEYITLLFIGLCLFVITIFDIAKLIKSSKKSSWVVRLFHLNKSRRKPNDERGTQTSEEREMSRLVEWMNTDN